MPKHILVRIACGAMAVMCGCGKAAAPPAVKMAEAAINCGQSLAASPGTSGIDPDMPLNDESVKGIERAGVSVSSFRAGLRKMKEDQSYAAAVAHYRMAQASPSPGGRPRMSQPVVTGNQRTNEPSGVSTTPIAHRIRFNGRGVYSKPFQGTGCGVVFEDNGKTGYLYATNEQCNSIFDALNLYNAEDSDHVRPDDEVYIVWNPALQKAGIYYHDQFHAVVDFANRRACCRSGFPEQGSGSPWPATSHRWDESMTSGLEP